MRHEMNFYFEEQRHADIVRGASLISATTVFVLLESDQPLLGNSISVIGSHARLWMYWCFRGGASWKSALRMDPTFAKGLWTSIMARCFQVLGRNIWKLTETPILLMGRAEGSCESISFAIIEIWSHRTTDSLDAPSFTKYYHHILHCDTLP